MVRTSIVAEVQEMEANINALKKLIREREEEKIRLKAEYEAAARNVEQAIIELKIELANIVLSGQEEPEVNENVVTLVSVQFNDRGKTYDYFWDSNDPVSIGDSVEVESKWGGFKTVTVVDVKKKEMELSELTDYKCAYPQGTKY